MATLKPPSAAEACRLSGASPGDSRVAPEVLRGSNFYNQAVVDVLVKQYGNLQSKIW